MKKIFILAAMCCFSPELIGQWQMDLAINNLLCDATNDQQDVRLVTDGDGGAIVAWTDFRAGNNNGDILVQRIDKNGFVKWTVNGASVCNATNTQRDLSITETMNGSAVIVWTDSRTAIDGEIYAQLIDSNGTPQWFANGVSLSATNSVKQNPKVIHDGLGGAIVVWSDSSGTLDYDIMAQHVQVGGTIHWGANGVAVCSFANKQINPRVETDGNNGAYITWQDKRFNNLYDIYLQRLNATGNALFTTNGMVVCNAADGQLNPKIEPNGIGGVVIAWQDKRNGIYDIYAQNIDASGTALWPPNGAIICNAFGSQSAIDIKYIGSNGFLFAWKDNRNPQSYDIYAQWVQLNGAALWGVNGMYIATGINPNVAADGAGNGVITWQDSLTGTWNVYAAKFNSTGTSLYNGNVLLSSAVGDQVEVKNEGDGNGGCIFAWQDARNGNDLDVYCTKLNNTFALSVHQATHVAMQLYPNPASDYLSFVSHDNGHYSIAATDGQIVGKGLYRKGTNLIDLHLITAGVFIVSFYDNDGMWYSNRLVIK